MKILFINGSPNKDGNTISLAKILLNSKPCETLNLVDYKIYSYGQNYPDDQFSEVVEKIKNSEIIVMASPLYWHSMSDTIRNLLDRFYGYIQQAEFSEKDLYFMFQGAAPTKKQLAASEYTIKRFFKLYTLSYKGMIFNEKQANDLLVKLY